jgi:hypothetical protein
MDTQAEDWIPTLMLRRRASEGAKGPTGAPIPLSSTFVGLIEPYEGMRFVHSVRRLGLANDDSSPAGDDAVAVEVVLADGRRDVLVSWPEPSYRAEQMTSGRLLWRRFDADGTLLDSWSANDGR